MSTSSIISRTQFDSIHTDDSIHTEADHAEPTRGHGRQQRDQAVDRRTECITDLPVGSLPIRIKHMWYLPLRAVCDWLLAIVLLVIALPIIAVSAIVVKWSSRGPAFYCQKRVGKNGRQFTLIKLRTMIDDAEALSGPVWAGANDSRITPFGRFLRDTHLDEFPQLFNVVLGQMSLIGPRPERPEFVAKLEWEFSQYRIRLKLRPGITGLPQLLLPPDDSLDSVRRKLVHDLYYVRNVSPWLDVRILSSTAWLMLKMIGRYVARMFALPDVESVERNLQQLIDGPHDEPRISFCETTETTTGTE